MWVTTLVVETTPLAKLALAVSLLAKVATTAELDTTVVTAGPRLFAATQPIAISLTLTLTPVLVSAEINCPDTTLILAKGVCYNS